MPRFRCKVLTEQGSLVATDLVAETSDDAIAALQRRRFYVVSVSSAERPLARLVALFRPSRPGIANAALALAVQQLAGLLADSVPLGRALEILARIAPSAATGALLGEVGEQVRHGASLHAALSRNGRSVPAILIAMAEAGEASGQLAEMLGQAALYLTRADALRRSTATALIYPVIIMATGAFSLGFVVFGVLPRFAVIFAEAGIELPLPTKMVIGLGEFATDWSWLCALAGAGLVIALRRRLRTPDGRVEIHGALLRVPLLGGLIRIADAARFCRALGTMVRAGIALPRGLAMAARTLANAAIAARLASVATALREGAALGPELARETFLPPMVAQMVAVGEEAGRVGDLLDRAADLLEQDFMRRVERLQAALVPGLTIALGAAVAALVASLMLALLRLNDLAG